MLLTNIIYSNGERLLTDATDDSYFWILKSFVWINFHHDNTGLWVIFFVFLSLFVIF